MEEVGLNNIYMAKHAYLLEIHHRKDLVDLLIDALDDKRNDIYMHIDIKSDLSFDMFKTKNAGLYNIESMNINWGGYSQIELALRLLEAATDNDHYSYYHLMQGSSYPLKNQDYLHDFYDNNQGKEFITIENLDNWHHKYQDAFNNDNIDNIIFKTKYYIKKIKYKLHIKDNNLTYKKGFSLWSITDDLARYIISKEKDIKRLFELSACGDEIFMQTMAYNSKFKDNINWTIKDIQATSLWSSTWVYEDNGLERKNHNFIYDDLDDLLNTDNHFARKFEGEDGIKLIEKIKKHINNNYE